MKEEDNKTNAGAVKLAVEFDGGLAARIEGAAAAAGVSPEQWLLAAAMEKARADGTGGGRPDAAAAARGGGGDMGAALWIDARGIYGRAVAVRLRAKEARRLSVLRRLTQGEMDDRIWRDMVSTAASLDAEDYDRLAEETKEREEVWVNVILHPEDYLLFVKDARARGREVEEHAREVILKAMDTEEDILRQGLIEIEAGGKMKKDRGKRLGSRGE